jgi:glycosyltransferase involved in cell wall biosynthesis
MNGVAVVSFAVSGNSVNGLEGDVAGYERFLLESRFDIVVNFAAQQWATDIALPLLPRIAGRKVFVPTGFSGLYSRRYQDYFRKLPAFMRQYDMNVFLSDCYRDVYFARKHGIANTVLIPNGAAADEFLGPVSDIRSQLGIPPDHFLILHVGSHTGLKGHEEAMEIFRQADIHNATLLIVGNEPLGGCGSLCRKRSDLNNASTRFQADGKRIVITPLSRSDTVSAYNAANLFLFPSNIECSPIVLFECMASRSPFLVTDVGNSSEIIDWSGGAGALLPSDSPAFLPRYGSLTSRIIQKMRIALGRADDFTAVRANIRGSVKLLESLYQDAARREEMSQAGFLAWQKRFTWEKITGEYETLYRILVEGDA